MSEVKENFLALIGRYILILLISYMIIPGKLTVMQGNT